MRPPKSLRSFALAAFLMFGAGLPGLHPSMAQSTSLALYALTEIKGGQGGHFVVDATINSQRISVMVDTGASVVALSYEDAERVGLHPRTLDFTVSVVTANGTTNAAHAKLAKVEIDSVRVDDVDALVLPHGALNGTLLGMSFLSRLTSFKAENGTLTLKN